jgi:hypothetical protein
MIMKKHALIALVVLSLLSTCMAAEEGISLFDGTMYGWRASENKGSWKIEDGCLVTRGPRSHLFYVGDVANHAFKNLELTAEVMTAPGSNSGIYVHTRYQETGWPSHGYECQVINSYPQTRPGAYVERKMTGSIYGVRNIWKAPAPDNQWFKYRIVVQGRTLRTYINDTLMAEYTEAASETAGKAGRRLSAGTIGLQCHDPKSVVRYRNIRVKLLPDDLPTPGSPLEDTEFDAQLISLAGKNLPLMDLHVHLKGGLTLDEALAHARQYGFTYGIAFNCGLQMTFDNEAALQQFLKSYEKPPHAYLAMQAEGREWLDLFSKEAIAQFDYVFTDAMTWTNDDGKRMRLWIPAETEVGDPQDFMDQLVDRIETIMSSEPVDIYVNPTYLPRAIASQYDALWTTARMDRVIKVLKDNGVALEINNRYKIPSAAFIKRAKQAGVQFTFGTNNGGRNDLGRMDYGIEMVKACGLRSQDFWVPGTKH